jgi:hypothetical protein
MYTGLYNFGVQGGARATCDSISCDACMTSWRRDSRQLRGESSFKELVGEHDMPTGVVGYLDNTCT